MNTRKLSRPSRENYPAIEQMLAHALAFRDEQAASDQQAVTRLSSATHAADVGDVDLKATLPTAGRVHDTVAVS